MDIGSIVTLCWNRDWYNFNKKIMQRLISIDNQRTLNSKRNQFIEALGRIKAGESQFKTRMNDTVYIQVNLVNHGLVDIIYLIDRDDIAIFKIPLVFTLLTRLKTRLSSKSLSQYV